MSKKDNQMAEKVYAIINAGGELYHGGWGFSNFRDGNWFTPMLTKDLSCAVGEIKNDIDFIGCHVVTFPDLKPVNLITCKVENGIVSWWRIGDVTPIVARGVVELENWAEEKQGSEHWNYDKNYFRLGEDENLGLYCVPAIGSYAVETGEVDNGR